MAKDKVFADGIVCFKPQASAPDFIKGDILIGIDVLLKWANDHPEYLHDYKGDRQIKLQLLDGTKGLYLTVNTYKKEGTTYAAPNKPAPSSKSEIQDAMDTLPF
jgi:hypothetical protein